MEENSTIANPANASVVKPVEGLSLTNEELISEWQEMEHVRPGLNPAQYRLFLLAGVVVAALLIFLGIWRHDINFYFIAVVVVLGILTQIVQNRRSTPRLKITLTSMRLIVGNNQHLISDLAGFWLLHDHETVVINVESQKASLVPISFLYANSNINEARSTMNQVMPELEPRLPSATDRVNRYFRF